MTTSIKLLYTIRPIYNLVKLSCLVVFVALFCLSCQTNSEGNKNSSTAKDENNTTTSPTNTPASNATKTILFFGNSLTAGYGLEPSQAFPALIQKKIDSLGLNYKVINSGLSGETSAGGKSRISWVLKQKVDVFILELGANDGLRGIDLQATKQNLQAIIDTVKAKSPEVEIIIAGMEMPPNMGQAYTTQFRNLYKDLAKENDAKLISFLLEGVGGVRELNQPDGIHPTAEGNKIVAENVWKVLEPVLRENT